MKKFSYIFLGCVSILLIYIFFGWPFVIKFQNAAFNYWVISLLTLSIPIGFLLVAIYSKHILVRPLAIIALLITLIPFTGVSIISVFNSTDVRKDGSDPSFEKIDEISVESNMYRLYVSNCGATCSFNMVMNKEIDLPIGMKIVINKWSMEDESQAKFVVTDSSIQIVRTILDERILAEIPK